MYTYVRAQVHARAHLCVCTWPARCAEKVCVSLSGGDSSGPQYSGAQHALKYCFSCSVWNTSASQCAARCVILAVAPPASHRLVHRSLVHVHSLVVAWSARNVSRTVATLPLVTELEENVYVNVQRVCVQWRTDDIDRLPPSASSHPLTTNLIHKGPREANSVRTSEVP